MMFRRNHYIIHENIPLCLSRTGAQLTARNDDDNQQHNYAHHDPDPHLHVLPPHLLADPICAATETLSGLIEVLGFVLELVDVLATLGDGFEVLFHNINSIVDLL